MKNAFLLCGALALASACSASSQTTGRTPAAAKDIDRAAVGPKATATTGDQQVMELAITTPETKQPAPIPAPSAEPQALAFPAEAFRARQPDATAPRSLRIPEIKAFKLANGIDVYLVQSNRLPVVSLELNFDGGSMNDPAGKEGLASVCMAMISEGTKTLTKVAFDEALADIASRVTSYAGRDTQGVAMSTLKKHFDKTYALYIDALLTPGFDAGEFNRLVQQRLEGLRQAKGSPASVARRVSDRILFGPNHPFGKVTTETSFQALTVQDCAQYHADYIKAKGARMFVVGDIDETTLRARFGKQALLQWSGKPRKSIRLPTPRPRRGKLFFLQVDNAKQSRISFMHFGPKRKARDYLATMGAGTILGGGFSGRLNMNLREDKGYSYSARGGFSYSRSYGEFRAGASVRTDATWQSVLELYDEIKGMKTGTRAATHAELNRELSAAILGLPGQFATLNQIRGEYRNLVYHRLPLNYYRTYVQTLRKLTLRQVKAAAKKHLSPERAVVLVVGDGQAPQIQHDSNKDAPLTSPDGQSINLIDSLTTAVKNGRIGGGDVVFLDEDGNVVAQ